MSEAAVLDDPKTEKPAKKPEKNGKPDFTDLTQRGKPKKETLAVKDVVRLTRLQTRSGFGLAMVDEDRAKDFAAKMKGGPDKEPEKFPPIKVMEVEDSPGHQGEPTKYLFDGFHTLAGCELAGIKEVEAQVWKGTWAQLLAASSTANVEHDSSGKPRTNADKVRAVKQLAAAYVEAEIPKAEWPSNRKLAEMASVSHQLVNEIDPFERSGSDYEEKKAKKRKVTAPPMSNGVPLIPTSEIKWEVRDKDGNVFGEVKGATRAEAAKKAEAKISGYNPKEDVIAQPVPPPAASGSDPAKRLFDWAGMDGHIGYIVRGLDALAEIHDLKKKPEFAGAERCLTEFVEYFRKWREKLRK